MAGERFERITVVFVMLDVSAFSLDKAGLWDHEERRP